MRKLVCTLASLIVYWTTGCTPLEDPDTVKPEDKLYLYAQNNNAPLKANGNDYAYLYARLPKDAGLIDVKFSTTGGSFVYSADKSISDYADSVSGDYRYAKALLKSDTSARIIYVTAEIPNARNQIPLTLTK